MSIKIEKSTNVDAVIPPKYHFDMDGITGADKIINDGLLAIFETAKERARAEFLEGAYSTEEIKLRTYQMDVRVGSIISVSAPSYNIPQDQSKNLFIVKRIDNRYTSAATEMDIIADRYNEYAGSSGGGGGEG